MKIKAKSKRDRKKWRAKGERLMSPPSFPRGHPMSKMDSTSFLPQSFLVSFQSWFSTNSPMEWQILIFMDYLKVKTSWKSLSHFGRKSVLNGNQPWKPKVCRGGQARTSQTSSEASALLQSTSREKSQVVSSRCSPIQEVGAACAPGDSPTPVLNTCDCH